MKRLCISAILLLAACTACSPGLMNNGGGENGPTDYAVSSVQTNPAGGVYASFGGSPVYIKSDSSIGALQVHSPIQVTYLVETLTFPGNAFQCRHDHYTTRWLSTGQYDQHTGTACGFSAGDYKMILEGQACLFRNGDPCPILNLAKSSQNFSVRT